MNKYSEVTIDKEKYHIPGAHPRQKLFVKIYWDRIEAYDCYGEEKIGQKPRIYVQKPELIGWGKELKIYIDKPRAVD